jgi:hypothetical protein
MEQKMETEVPEDDREDTNDSAVDWDSRVLCSDGNCIGVIGPDGHCKECGIKYEGDPPEMRASENEAQDVEEDDDLSSAPTEIPEENNRPFDDEWENRVLCSDGNCIGVIGPDGKCRECGKPLE